MKQWLVRLQQEALRHAGGLRLQAIEICEHGGEVWLRGSAPFESVEPLIRRLPGAERFFADEEGRLVPQGKSVPTAKVPPGPWSPLKDALRLQPQIALLPGTAPERVKITLIRSEHPREANALLANLHKFARFVINAPVVRLRGLSFAVNKQRAIVRASGNTPVPPIPGVYLVDESGLAIPCGFEMSPIRDVAVVRAALGAAPDEYILFSEDGGFELISAADFAPVTRSSLRATLAQEAAR
ncbi:MAG TPA: hypothetical protein VEJ63_14375 [Planctomycetota bacterium]|nr:hypothetical protein [Planctomycetota bacterium]